MVKNPPAVWETWVWSLGYTDTLEKGTATHSSILTWRIPHTEEPGRLQSMGLQKVRHDWMTFTLQAVQNRFQARFTLGSSWSTCELIFSDKCFFHVYLFIFYWSIVDLQCCFSFRCTSKYFIYCCLVPKSPLTLTTSLDYTHQASLSMGFPRQEYSSGLPFPSPGGSSQLRDWTCMSCIGRQILYYRATRAGPISYICVCYTVLSHFIHVWLFVTPWTASLSMILFHQEY